MKITVVSPHRGDSAFALGLTIETWLRQGHIVEVVNCFTRSEFAPYSDAQSLHENDRMSFVTAVRKREDEAWCKQYGAAKLTLTDLNLKDAPGRLHCGPEEVFGHPADVSEKVVSKIRRSIEMSKPAALVLPLGIPGGQGAHVDHISARDAALMSPLITVPLAFYEELPHALKLTPEQIASVVHELSSILGAELQQMFVRDGNEPATEAAVKRRRRIALCYDSQIDETLTTQIAEFCRAYDGRERLWSNPAWRAL